MSPLPPYTHTPMSHYLFLATLIGIASCLWFFWVETIVNQAVLNKVRGWFMEHIAYAVAMVTYILLCSTIIAYIFK